DLGVSVPLPMDNDKVIEAIMKAVLLHPGGMDPSVRQLRFDLDLGQTEREVETAWETAKNRMTRTIFAQHGLRPEGVPPVWRQAVEVLAGEEDVERFVRLAAQRLGAPLEPRKGAYPLPVAHVPRPLPDRLETIGTRKALRIAFRQPAPDGAEDRKSVV